MGSFAFTTSSSGVSGIDIGISGLNAARLALQVLGHNIANVNTPGYSRQQVQQTTRYPAMTAFGALGRGTKIVGIEALRDRFLEAQLNVESRTLGRLQTIDNILGQVESIYNPMTGGGLNEATDNFFNSFSDLAANPESLAQREETLAFGQNIAMRSREVLTRLQGMQDSINAQIRSTVGEINTMLSEIAKLNASVVSGEATGLSAEDYRDKRNLLLKELNELMGVDSFEDEHGSLTIVTRNGAALVVRSQYAELSAEPNTLEPNRLKIYSTFNGARTDITDGIDGGRLGALVEYSNGTLASMMAEQRRFAVVLADAFNVQHRLGTDLSGAAGGDFFASPFNILDGSTAADGAAYVVGEHSTYEINYDVTDASATANITDIDIADPSALAKHDYRIVFTDAAGNFDVYDLSSGAAAPVATGTVPGGGGTVTVLGMDITFDAVPASGDSFELQFDGRTGVTGHTYRIEFTDNAGSIDYEVYDTTTLDTTPVATGTGVAAGEMIYFDGLVFQVDAIPADGDFFNVGYSGLQVDSAIAADSSLIAASDSPPGSAEPGNNGNALELAALGAEAMAGLANLSFSQFQSGQISSVGTLKADAADLLSTQETFMNTLEQQRDAVSGVSLDEEAAKLIEYQQAYQANARYISSVNDLIGFLLGQLLQ